MSDLPDGWIESTLGEVAAWGSGGTPSRTKPEYYGGKIPWIKTGELGQGIITDTEEKITELGLKNSSAKIFRKGSVAIALYGATIGKTSILGIDAATNQACAVGFPIENAVTSEYLHYYLMSQKDGFINSGQGGAQPNISQGIVKGWFIPLAPLHEQKRIAEKLDQVLARVDACQTHLERVPQILKRFRQSVLAAATSGQLTEGWREEQGKDIKPWIDTIPENGVSLPEDYERLGKIAFKLTIIEHSAKGLPETWSLLTIADLYHNKTLIDFADGNHGAMYPRKEDFGDKGALFLTATQIGETWEVDIAACPRLRSDKAEKLVKGWARKNDVLLTHNATVGRVGLLEFGEEDVLLGTSVTFYRFNENYISPNYGRILFSSPFFQDQLKMEMAQTTRNQVPITKQVSFNFICPPIEEQAEIVRRVEKLFAYAAKLEARYQSASERVERLTPSLLAKAFRGGLVGQDPNDESASALVGRIRETRDAQKADPSVKSKKSKRS